MKVIELKKLSKFKFFSQILFNGLTKFLLTIDKYLLIHLMSKKSFIYSF